MLKQEHRKLMSSEQTQVSVLEGLKSNLDAIQSALNKERIFGIISLPIMLMIGLSFKKLQKGSSFSEIFASEYSLGSIMGMIVFILVLGFASDKMNKIAFGEYIAKLEDQIKQIEKVS